MFSYFKCKVLRTIPLNPLHQYKFVFNLYKDRNKVSFVVAAKLKYYIYILNTKWKSNSLIPRQFCLGQFIGL